MFWGDSIIDDFLAEYGDEAKNRQLILRDEKTLSGRPHVGSLRSFVMHAILSDVLTSRGVDNVFIYEINDTDAFDSVPAYVPDEWEEHLGKQLKDVPSPDGKAESYAMYFAKEYTDALTDSKYNAEFYVSSHKYKDGEYDKYIKLALDHKDDIRKIYKEVSGSDKDESWYPCQVICDKCGKIATTEILNWDGEELEYACSADRGYTKGCGHKAKKSPYGGNSTLPWKVEWAAKFCIIKVDLEGAGKDHYAAGGSRHVSNRICEEIFDRKHPFDVRHEFILLQGAKMSSSSGVGATAVGVYELMPRYIFRFMMIQKDIMKTISFSPSGDTFPVLFDQYDEVCRDYFEGGDDVKAHKNSIFEFTHFYEEDLKKLNRFLPRFSQIAFFVQMPHLDVKTKVTELKGSPLTDIEEEELDLRIKYAKKWLESCSPEKYIFKVQEEVPQEAGKLSREQKDFLKMLSEFLNENPEAEGEAIQGFIHEQKDKMGMAPKDIFSAIYNSILGKDSGPKAGWLLEALENKFLMERFESVSALPDHVVEEVKIDIPEERLKNDHFYLSQEAAEKFPEVRICYAIIEGIKVEKSSEGLPEFREKMIPSSEEAEDRLANLDILKEYVDLYKRQKVDTTKRKPTSIALLDRLVKGKGLYEINNVVDVCNLMTLEDGVSFGAFDTDNIKFPVSFDVTKGGEEFWALMDKKPKKVGPGELCMIDQEGKVLNRDYNYRDSEYTKITPETKNVILIMDILDSTPTGEVEKKFNDSIETFIKYCGGEVKFKLVA